MRVRNCFNSTKLQPLKFAFVLFNLGKCFIEYADLFIFFQTKLFQNFVKLLKTFIPYLNRCPVRPHSTYRENIARKNPVQSLSSFLYGAFSDFPFISIK